MSSNPRSLGVMVGSVLSIGCTLFLIYIVISRDQPKRLILPIALLLISGVLAWIGGLTSDKILSGYEKYIKKD